MNKKSWFPRLGALVSLFALVFASGCASSSNYVSIPEGIGNDSTLVPQKILGYVTANFPKSKIVKYSKEYKTVCFIPVTDTYVITLDSGKVLQFDGSEAIKIQ